MSKKKKKKHLDNLYRDGKKPACFFSIAYGDQRNKDYARMMVNSLRKFHSNVPHYLFTDEDIDKIPDPQKKFRLYAIFGEQLAKEYDLVIQIDGDSVVTGDLSHIINNKNYDVGGVLNNNLIDPKLSIYDVDPAVYINAGFVAIRGERPWKWWNRLNHTPFFERHQFKEQDMLNIMFHYGDLRCTIFDFSDKWHGLVSKGQWHRLKLKDKKIVLPKTEGICGEEKEIKIIHWAGGSVPKLNFHVWFDPEVVKRLKELTS